MPLRPPAYPLPEGGAISSTGTGYGSKLSTGALTPSGGSPGIRVAQMNTEALAGFWKSISNVGKHLAEQEALKQKAVFDNEVMARYSEGVLAMDDLSRQLKSEGVGSDRYMSEWEKRTGKLLSEIDKRVSSPDVRRSLAHKLIPHVVETRLKAGLYSDGLLRDETLAQIRKFGEISEGQAANLLMPEQPLVQGSKSYAFGFLEDLNDRIDVAERRGIIKREEATEWKRKYRESAHYARAEVMARETPGVFLQRAKDAGDALVSNLDPNAKIALVKRAEERETHLRTVRLAEDKRAEQVTKDSQDRWLGTVKTGMDIAFQTNQNLDLFTQEVIDMGHLLGPENKSKAFDHLRVLQSAARERGAVKAKPWTDDDHARFAVAKAKVFAGAYGSPTEILRDGTSGTFRVDKADELVTLWYSMREDTRKDEITANTKHVERMLNENIGMIARFNKTAATAMSLASNEFATTALADRALTGPKLAEHASKIIDRYTRSVTTQMGKPEELLKALPVVKGIPLRDPTAIMKAWKDGDISEMEANRYKAIVDYVGTVQGVNEQKTGDEKKKADEEKKQKEQKPGAVGTISEMLFGKGLKKGDRP